MDSRVILPTAIYFGSVNITQTFKNLRHNVELVPHKTSLELCLAVTSKLILCETVMGQSSWVLWPISDGSKLNDWKIVSNFEQLICTEVLTYILLQIGIVTLNISNVICTELEEIPMIASCPNVLV